MIREKFKYIDPFSLTMPVFLYSGILAFKGNFKISILFFILFLVLLYFIKRLSPGLLIENNYNGAITVKLENGCNEITNTFKTPVEIDAVKTDANPNIVYKVIGGTNVYIDKKGIVKAYSPISQLSIVKLTQSPDTCWNKIFMVL